MKLRLNHDVPPSERMTRKDSEKESERPHYYSQFWLDVAAGRRIIGAPKPNDETEMEPEMEPVNLRKPLRSSSTATDDGYAETIAHPEVEPEFDADEFAEPEADEVEQEDLADFAAPVATVPPVDETEIPDVDLTPLEEEEEEEDEFFDEEEEEEEDDLGWGGARGRKKPKPGRQVKPPKKPTKREPRRGY